MITDFYDFVSLQTFVVRSCRALPNLEGISKVVEQAVC